MDSSQWRPGSREIFQGSWEKSLNRCGVPGGEAECPAEELEVHIVSGIRNSGADLRRSCI